MNGNEQNPALTKPARASQFSLATILLVITLIAVCLGALRLSPCLGVPLILLGVPALIRTFIVGRYEAKRGNRLTLREKVGEFVISLIVVMLVMFMSSIAGGMAAMMSALVLDVLYISLFNQSITAWLSLVIGGSVWIAVSCYLFWLFRPSGVL